MDGIHSMQILYKGDNGELLMFSWQHFATAASPPPFPPSLHNLCNGLTLYVRWNRCLLWNCFLNFQSKAISVCYVFALKYIQKNIYPGFWLHLLEVSHGAAQIMLSCLWKKSTQLDLPLQDSLWMRSMLLGWSSKKLRFKLSFKMSA